MRSIATVLVFLAAMLASAQAQPQAPTAEVVAVHPGSVTSLPRDAILRLRIAYDSPYPLTLSATLVDGQGVAIGINGGSALRPAGRGEAALWVGALAALSARAIDLRLAPHETEGEAVRLRMPMAITFTDAPGGGGTPAPAWFTALDAEQKQAWSEYYAAQPPRDPGLMADVVSLAWPLYPIAQIAMLFWLRGFWRLAAALPLIVTGPLYAIVLWAMLVEANVGLLPIVVIFVSAPALAYLVVLALVRSGLAVLRP